MSAERTDSGARRLATLRERLDRGMDRRAFLRTLVNAGYALGVASLLGVEDFLEAERGHVPVVTALVRSDPDDPWSLEERTEEVPAEWYAAVTKAFEVHDLLASTQVPGYLGSAVLPGSYGSPTASISIDISPDDFERANEKLASLLDGVNVTVDTIEGVEELEEETPSGNPHLIDEGRGRDVPGGVGCEVDGPTSATLTPALYRRDGRRSLFATAHHAYLEHDDPTDQPLFLTHPSGDRLRLGTVRHEHPVADLVAVERGGELRPASRIQGASPERVIGQYTRVGLADLAARDEPLQKVATMTGHTEGRIDGVAGISCLTGDVCRRGQLLWGSERDFTDGDSGSVSYHPHPDEPDRGVLIAGMNNARTWWPGQNYIWGTAAYRITDEYGYHF